jgi:hypothetical protein
MTSKMAGRISAAARCAPRRVRPATPGPVIRAADAVRLRPWIQLPVAARDPGGYGQPGRAAAGPTPHGHTPA